MSNQNPKSELLIKSHQSCYNIINNQHFRAKKPENGSKILTNKIDENNKTNENLKNLIIIDAIPEVIENMSFNKKNSSPMLIFGSKKNYLQNQLF